VGNYAARRGQHGGKVMPAALPQLQQQQQLQQQYPSQPEVQGLNLSQTGEVGLNLTVENGINLSSNRAHSGQTQASTSAALVRKGNYLYNAQSCMGYVNLSTYAGQEANSNNKVQQQQQQRQQHLQQPLNLDVQHRSSPLNLTAGPVQGQQQFFQQAFGHPQQQQQQQPQQQSQANQHQMPDGATRLPNYSCAFGGGQQGNQSHQSGFFGDTMQQQYVEQYPVEQQQQQRTHSSTYAHGNGNANTQANTGVWGLEDFADFPVVDQEQQDFQSANDLSVLGEALDCVVNTEVQQPPASEPARAPAPPEPCPECFLTFTSGKELKKHMDLMHMARRAEGESSVPVAAAPPTATADQKPQPQQAKDSSKPFSCNRCRARFCTHALLNRHVKRVHRKEQTHKCELCGKGFYERTDLKRHERTHARAASVPDCPDCGRAFASKYASEKHKCPGPEGKFACDLCSQKLRTKMLWGAHMWKHTKDIKYIILKEEDEMSKK